MDADKVVDRGINKMIRIKLAQDEFEVIKKMARGMEIGGHSNIRTINQRLDTLSEDQLTGAVCEAGLHRYWYGHCLEYFRSRYYRNQMPNIGDNGSDICPLNIDVKGSMLRNGMPLDKFHLVIRPSERKKDWVFILAIYQPDLIINLMGWLEDKELEKYQIAKAGTFNGAYVVPANDLHLLPPLRALWLPR